MAANRLSSLNIVLLIITLASVLLATYSFIQGGPRNSRNDKANEDVSVTDNPGRVPRCSPRDGWRRDGVKSNPGRDFGPADPEPGDNPGKAGTGGGGGGPSDPPPHDPFKAVESRPSDSGTAAITGSVVDGGGRPVSGMTVSARRSNFGEIMPSFDGIDMDRYKREMAEYLANAERETRTTTTNGEGKFAFTGLDTALAYDIRAISGGTGGAQQNRVAAGDTVTLVLSLEGVLRGCVTGADGKPLQKFTILIQQSNQYWNQRRQVFNTSDGTYTMTLPYGQRRVQVNAPGLATPAGVDVTIGPTEAVANFALGAAAMLSGVVLDQTGRPLADASVWIQGTRADKDKRAAGEESESMSAGRRSFGGPSRDQPYNASVNTDTQGRYRFDSVTPGEYDITAQYGSSTKKEKITLNQGENRKDFALDSGVRVTIRLSDGNSVPLEPDNVWFVAAKGGNAQAKRLPITERGLLEYAGLKAGDYTINISVMGFPQFMRKETLKESVLNQFTYQMSPGATISGAITTSSGGAIGTQYQARLTREGEDANAGWGQGRYGPIGADGTFKLGPVEVGEWNLEVMNQNWQPVHKEKVNLTAGENKVSISVDTGGVLRLNVTTEDGSAVTWCTVNLAGGEGKNYHGYVEKGVVTISFITPGNYKMTVQTQAGTQSSDVYIRNGLNDHSVTIKAPNCLKITSVSPNSQAATIGLQVGDLLFEYNGKKVNNMNDIYKYVRETKETDNVSLVVERNGVVLNFTLKGGLIGITGDDAVR